MSKRTKAKERREKEYHQRVAARRDQEADAFMNVFGLLPVYRSLPSRVRELLRRHPRFETEVVAGVSLGGDPSSIELFDMVRTAVLNGQPDRPPPSPISLKTLYAALFFAQDACRLLGVDPAELGLPGYAHPSGPAGKFTRAFAETAAEGFPHLHYRLTGQHLAIPLHTRSSLGERQYWAGLRFGPTGRAVYTIERTDFEPVPTVIRGASRPTRPCQVCQDMIGRPLPAVWTAGQIGLPGDRSYPVHIQSHAIHQWEQRLPARMVHNLRFQLSLDDPVIVDARQGSGMLAYTDGRNRFGYFPFALSDDGERVVLTTFLFLTMQGTPEYRLLGERLGLSRADIEYHRLDRAERFFQSDLPFDKDLAGRLGECGLGHLLDPYVDPEPLLWRGAATELRKYMGLSTM